MTAKNNESAVHDSSHIVNEEILFQSKYHVSELTLDDASDLYGSNRLKSMSSVVSLLLLVVLILLALAFPEQIVLLGIGAIIVAVSSTLATNWFRVQRHFIGKSSLDKLIGTKCVATLTDNYVRITANGEEVDTFPLEDLRRVNANELGCLADFGKKRVAYFQQKGMSRSKFSNLISSLDVILLANEMSKKSKRKHK